MPLMCHMPLINKVISMWDTGDDDATRESETGVNDGGQGQCEAGVVVRSRRCG
jgi:hypothetical protein